jgi:hypothetical protein
MTTTTQTLSKISQLLLVNVLYLFTILFFTTTNKTKPKQKKRPQFQIPKMHAKDGSHTIHTLTSVFFWDNCFWSFFVFVLVDKRNWENCGTIFFGFFPL